MTARILWIIVGVLSILAGILALANPLAATLTAELIAGWSFLFIGILEIIAAFQVKGWGGRIWIILLGIACVILGIVMLRNPLAGVVSLTILAASLFLVNGIFKVVASFSLRKTGGFWLLLLSGALSIILSIMIFSNFPASALTILGVMLAVELISNGIALIGLSGTREATDGAA